MGRRAVQETIVGPETTSNGANGETSAESRGQLTSAQRLSASSASLNEVAPDPFGREGKHFTEIRVLNRDVSTVFVANLCFICSVKYKVLFCAVTIGPDCPGGC